MLPEGFELRPVDAALLEHARLKNLDALREEMCSERPSVQEFLDHSFGVCLVHGYELAGWCLSEYNTPDACEIGIETREPFRRRGLAALMTAALVEEAQARGVARIGWHCWTSNIPSARTALKAGFELAVDYPACMVWFDEAVNLAAHGAECLDRACYGEALEWFERAFERAADTAPGWAHWGAACAAARLELHDIALRHLTAALDMGFGDLEHLQSSEHLESLRQTAGWRVMLAARAGGSPTSTI